MLDQNTDRMWFVIGAVIVGAAIIFIANGTIPEIFASVTDSFEEASNEATGVIDEIVPNTSEVEVELARMTSFLNNPDNWQQGGIRMDGEDSENLYALSIDHLRDVVPGTYTIRMTTTRDYRPVVGFRMYDENDVGIDFSSDKAYEHTVVITEDVSSIRLRIIYKELEMNTIIEDTLHPEEINNLQFTVTKHERQ